MDRTRLTTATVYAGLMTCALGGCAGTPGTGQSGPAARGTASCSTRLIVNMRPSMGPGAELELLSVARRVGVRAEVLREMGRGSSMVQISGMGPQALCEAAVEEMSLDPRIESIRPYY